MCTVEQCTKSVMKAGKCRDHFYGTDETSMLLAVSKTKTMLPMKKESVMMSSSSSQCIDVVNQVRNYTGKGDNLTIFPNWSHNNIPSETTIKSSTSSGIDNVVGREISESNSNLLWTSPFNPSMQPPNRPTVVPGDNINNNSSYLQNNAYFNV